MYFSLSNLSFLDICYSSNSVPFSALRNYPTISYTSCYAQMVISLFLGMTECLLLAVMAYDRFIAISNPLHYTIIINNQVCIQLAAVTWASAFLLAEIPITAILAHFCGHNLIKHFTCETQALLKLICLETPVRLILGLVIGIFTLPLPLPCWRSVLQRPGSRLSPPVDPIHLWSTYFMGQPYTCTWNLSQGSTRTRIKSSRQFVVM